MFPEIESEKKPLPPRKTISVAKEEGARSLLRAKFVSPSISRGQCTPRTRRSACMQAGRSNLHAAYVARTN